ncbi:MAG TPA: polysaccharide biosynthesis protein GtrA [Cellvibrio sp.]|nr:polysaccharide biosynthesis protein GtrA [Cellvibrio sp.]
MLAVQFVRFLAVGVVNTLFGYSIYALLIYLGLAYTYALLFATILGVLFNFQTIGRLVFQSRDKRLIGKFFAVYAITFCLNLLLIKLMIKLGLSAYLAGALALIPTTVLSFLLNKFFVFKGKKHEAH